MRKFGNSWLMVSNYIKTRTPTQARSHAQKYYQALEQEEISKVKDLPENERPLFVVVRHYLNRTFNPLKDYEKKIPTPDSSSTNEKSTNPKISNHIFLKNLTTEKINEIKASGILIPIPSYPNISNFQIKDLH